MGKQMRHSCPGRTCGRTVPDVLFCCAEHWHRLSSAAKAGIAATAMLSVLSAPRRAAIQEALIEWGQR